MFVAYSNNKIWKSETYFSKYVMGPLIAKDKFASNKKLHEVIHEILIDKNGASHNVQKIIIGKHSEVK